MPALQISHNLNIFESSNIFNLFSYNVPLLTSDMGKKTVSVLAH